MDAMLAYVGLMHVSSDETSAVSATCTLMHRTQGLAQASTKNLRLHLSSELFEIHTNAFAALSCKPFCRTWLGHKASKSGALTEMGARWGNPNRHGVGSRC